MSKPRQPSHAPFRIGDLLVPTVTLGFYGLRRFRPRWLYNLVAFVLLGAWVALAIVAACIHEGGEYLVIPPVFLMVGVTFLRLLPRPTRHVAAER